MVEELLGVGEGPVIVPGVLGGVSRGRLPPRWAPGSGRNIQVLVPRTDLEVEGDVRIGPVLETPVSPTWDSLL